MANKIVAGELYESITGQLFEIGRQLRQKKGYPYNPKALNKHLQDAIEGKFSVGGFQEQKSLTPEKFIELLPKIEEEKDIIHEFGGFTAPFVGKKHCGQRMIKIRRFQKENGVAGPVKAYETIGGEGCLSCGYFKVDIFADL